jgi:hypothetical protein
LWPITATCDTVHILSLMMDKTEWDIVAAPSVLFGYHDPSFPNAECGAPSLCLLHSGSNCISTTSAMVCTMQLTLRDKERTPLVNAARVS